MSEDFQQYFGQKGDESISWVPTLSESETLSRLKAQTDERFSDCKTVAEFAQRINQLFPMPHSFQSDPAFKFNLDRGISCAPAALVFYEWAQTALPDYLVYFIAYNGYADMHYLVGYLKSIPGEKPQDATTVNRFVQMCEDYNLGIEVMNENQGFYDLIKDSDDPSDPVGFLPVDPYYIPNRDELLNQNTYTEPFPQYSLLLSPQELLTHYYAYLKLIQERRNKYLK